jgi:hypothetical protein
MRASRSVRARAVQPPHLQLRAGLMDAVRRLCAGIGRASVMPPRCSREHSHVPVTLYGEGTLFSVDALVDMFVALGVTVSLESDDSAAEQIQRADSPYSLRSCRRCSNAVSGPCE